MEHKFKVGDHVRWNSEFGKVEGRVTKIYTGDFVFFGRSRRASEDEPQYEVKSEKTGHLAVHKETALVSVGINSH